MLMASFAGGALVLLQPERFVAPGRAAAAEEGGEGEEEGRCADALASTAAPRSSVTAKIGGNDRDQLASSHHEATSEFFQSEFSVLGKATERSDLVRCEFLFLALRRGDALVDDQREIVSRHWHCWRSHFISDTRNS